ncbi:hypothetical protein HY3_09380 [Hyphomonas pacifica]|uniref:Flagellar hook-length control protein-like C-terminal domain-containing protein n=1 Tax=Hyphomonas pacifica TaxID=1280941 RepID=A0A062U1Q0_9PROT|nr:hypothetical protein HY2_09250 [Hyphomonas pacifica]RAN35046.1 hypothetical protein HY3_09380 [Hyphomonas pacifica]
MPLSPSTDSALTTQIRAGQGNTVTVPDESNGKAFLLHLATLGEEAANDIDPKPETRPQGDQTETAQLALPLLKVSDDRGGNPPPSVENLAKLTSSHTPEIAADPEDVAAHLLHPLQQDVTASKGLSTTLAEPQIDEVRTDLAEQRTSLQTANTVPDKAVTTVPQDTETLELDTEDERKQAEVQPPLANPAAIQATSLNSDAALEDMSDQTITMETASRPETKTVSIPAPLDTQKPRIPAKSEVSTQTLKAIPSAEDPVASDILTKEGISSLTAEVAEPGTQKKVADSSLQLSPNIMQTITASQPPVPSSAVATITPQPTSSGAYIAAPADIPTIVSQELSTDNKHNKISVQLDPPELGRVSIEFKFDSQGLQHVLVTADSAEAVRRIRTFHQDLVSVLEQNGLTSQDMTFREQSSGQNSSRSHADHSTQTLTDRDIQNSKANVVSVTEPPARTISTGLDIRL